MLTSAQHIVKSDMSSGMVDALLKSNRIGEYQRLQPICRDTVSVISYIDTQVSLELIDSKCKNNIRLDGLTYEELEEEFMRFKTTPTLTKIVDKTLFKYKSVESINLGEAYKTLISNGYPKETIIEKIKDI